MTQGLQVKGWVSVLSVTFWCRGLAQRVMTLVELTVTLVQDGLNFRH